MNRESVYEKKFRYYYITEKYKQKLSHGTRRATAGIV